MNAGGANERPICHTRRRLSPRTASSTSRRRLIRRAAAVPVWSATSNDLRSSSSSRQYCQPASHGTTAICPEEEIVERHGNKLHISKQRLDRAHRWFERFGAPVIVVSRCIPFARAAFPYAAGVARMGYGRFLVFGTIGSIIWISALGVLGNAVGSQWQSWRHNLEYVDYVAAALLVAAIAYLIVRITRSRRGDPTAVA